MQKDSKLFDDIARLASGAAGELMEMKREIEAQVARSVEKLLQKMDLATREELDTALQMTAKLRTEQEELKKRLEELENRLKKGDFGQK